MANIILTKELSGEEKLSLMRQDACYDVADDDDATLPDLASINADIKARKSPPKVPKVFLSNNCAFNCAYCGCRCSRDKDRYLSSPRELAELSVSQAKTNKHGVFVTSAIYKNADYTEELIIETLRIMRKELHYKGYLHAKIMPGTDPELIRQAGLYANRLSVNIEVAKSEGYSMVAKNKSKSNILTPMGQISGLIRAAKEDKSRFKPDFATSQTTQLMAGSTNEDDYTILRLSKAMYKKYDLKRVYYTAFHYTHPAVGYDELEFKETPKWRVARLYQADRLMALYGFTPEEIAPESAPRLSEDIDPKAAWALRNIHLFPVDVNKADYELLLRVPGIGLTYAARIIKARQYTKITPEVLKNLGVSLKRSGSFITCDGKYFGVRSDKPEVLRGLLKNDCFEQLAM